MITWTGLGILFFLMPFLMILAVALFLTIFGMDMQTYLPYSSIIGIILSAILCWFLGKIVNKEKIVSYDTQTGQPIITKNQHTLWGMPVQYFSIVLLVFLIVCFIILILPY